MKKNNKLNTFEMLAGLIIAGIAFGAQSQTSVHLKQTGDMASSWYDDDIWNDDDLNTPQMKTNKPHTTKVTSTAHQIANGDTRHQYSWIDRRTIYDKRSKQDQWSGRYWLFIQ